MSFELQPILMGEWLELRPLRADDFQALSAVPSAPLIWEQHPMSDRYKEDVFSWTFLARACRGGTYNREMKPRNYRSQKAMEKIGGVGIDTRTDASGLGRRRFAPNVEVVRLRIGQLGVLLFRPVRFRSEMAMKPVRPFSREVPAWQHR